MTVAQGSQAHQARRSPLPPPDVVRRGARHHAHDTPLSPHEGRDLIAERLVLTLEDLGRWRGMA